MSVINALTLRRALVLDAAASGLTAALLIAGANTLQGPLGLPAPLMHGAGVVLAPYVALVVLTARRTPISGRAVWTVIACNALWTAASFALLASGAIAPTPLGTAFVAAQALAVAALGALQYIALRRPRAAVLA